MLMLDISEWIANIFILGIAVVLWAIGIFLFSLIIYTIIQFVKKLSKGEVQ